MRSTCWGCEWISCESYHREIICRSRLSTLSITSAPSTSLLTHFLSLLCCVPHALLTHFLSLLCCVPQAQNGNTPLHYAANNSSSVAVVQALLAANPFHAGGRDATVPSRMGSCTPAQTNVNGGSSVALLVFLVALRRDARSLAHEHGAQVGALPSGFEAGAELF